MVQFALRMDQVDQIGLCTLHLLTLLGSIVNIVGAPILYLYDIHTSSEKCEEMATVTIWIC